MASYKLPQNTRAIWRICGNSGWAMCLQTPCSECREKQILLLIHLWCTISHTIYFHLGAAVLQGRLLLCNVLVSKLFLNSLCIQQSSFLIILLRKIKKTFTLVTDWVKDEMTSPTLFVMNGSLCRVWDTRKAAQDNRGSWGHTGQVALASQPLLQQSSHLWRLHHHQSMGHHSCPLCTQVRLLH